jgi:hypothetical protein
MEFNPDLVLGHNERAAVMQTIATPGYTVIHRLMRAEVDKFIVNLINAPEEDEKTVAARHKLVKAAAQFYQAITERINFEAVLYKAAVAAEGDPVDLTEGILEMGAPASRYSDLEAEAEKFFRDEESVIE